MKPLITPFFFLLSALPVLADHHGSDGEGGGWISLFDGKTLDGWVQKNGTARYRVDDGAIVGTTVDGSPNSFLTSEKSYSDFELEFDVKVEGPLNSGVQIRSATKGDGDNGRVNGPQVEIEPSGADGGEAGYIYGEATGKGWLTAEEDLKPHQHFKDGEWNHYRVIARGPRIQTFINGSPIADLKENSLYDTHSSGFLGLQVHGIEKGTGPYSVAWKDIKIKPLDAASNGAVSIFDGTSTKGWFITPENPKIWQVTAPEDGRPGELSRRPTQGYIWYEQPVEDFLLTLEFRLSPGCNSGVFFRTDPENPVQRGFEVQVYDSHGQEPGLHNAGALYDARAASTMAVKPAGEWNTMQLKAVGSKVVVHMNGKKVQDLDLDDWTMPNTNPDGSKNKFNTALKDLPRTGHIGFQDHGHDVSYRNIKLQKL